MLVWDWLDPDFIKPLPRRNPFSARWGLDQCFVVLYAGNIGLSQGLEYVLEAARLLSGEPEIRFVFVGDGAARKNLEEQATLGSCNNVCFIPFQPRELLPYVLASADISLISLRQGVSADSVPSKLYSILASGRPVVAAVDPGSDTWRLVESANCGSCVNPEDPEALAAAILGMYRDETRRLEAGANGRNYAVTHHSRTAAARKFHEAILALGTQRRVRRG